MFPSKILTVIILVSYLAGCKHSDHSSTKDVEDTEAINYVPSENKFYVKCREGKLHHGQRSVIVSKEELSTVCEEDASGGGGGGGGSGGGNGDFLAECGALPAAIADVSIGISHNAATYLQNQPQVVRKKVLCDVFINQNLVGTLIQSPAFKELLLARKYTLVVDYGQKEGALDDDLQLVTLPLGADVITLLTQFQSYHQSSDSCGGRTFVFARVKETVEDFCVRAKTRVVGNENIWSVFVNGSCNNVTDYPFDSACRAYAGPWPR
ncbi:MAG: hypothetical protein AB7T49_20290 [Oligoflexales bacterium]